MFRLALALGRTVAELETSMSARELAEWQAYSLIEPFGQARSDEGARLLTWLLYEVNKGKGGRKLTPADFLKTPWDSRPKPMRPGELAASLKAAFSGLRKA